MCVVTNCICAKVSGEIQIQIQTRVSSSKGLRLGLRADVSDDGVLSSLATPFCTTQ